MSDITSRLTAGHTDHEDRMQKAEYNVTAAASVMSTVTSNVDEVKTEMGKMRAVLQGGGL